MGPDYADLGLVSSELGRSPGEVEESLRVAAGDLGANHVFKVDYRLAVSGLDGRKFVIVYGDAYRIEKKEREQEED